jgi:hypothetical protein
MFRFDPHLASADQSPATCRTKTVDAVIATRGLDRRGSNPGPLSARSVEICFVAQGAPRNDSANLIEICSSRWEASRSDPVPPARGCSQSICSKPHPALSLFAVYVVAAAARPPGGLTDRRLGNRYLFPLFYQVEIRHRQLLQSQSRTALGYRCDEGYRVNKAIT